ncbi:MAG: DnaJ domain-containing protein [Defluviitaleaceae bacterium]|nr:DnaJ domain-containing protein [Defluviitaleaceae bacterium]
MKNYTYFLPLPQTAEALKKAYRKLAQKYHPDTGGDTEKMKVVNVEYAELFEKLKNIHTNADGEQYTKDTNETPEEFINIINQLIRFDGVLIEIIGSFIWVSGETKPYKEQLKALKFKWSSNKLSWYLAPNSYKKRNHKNYSMDDIRNMYDSQEVENKPYKKLAK